MSCLGTVIVLMRRIELYSIGIGILFIYNVREERSQ